MNIEPPIVTGALRQIWKRLDEIFPAENEFPAKCFFRLACGKPYPEVTIYLLSGGGMDLDCDEHGIYVPLSLRFPTHDDRDYLILDASCDYCIRDDEGEEQANCDDIEFRISWTDDVSINFRVTPIRFLQILREMNQIHVQFYPELVPQLRQLFQDEQLAFLEVEAEEEEDTAVTRWRQRLRHKWESTESLLLPYDSTGELINFFLGVRDVNFPEFIQFMLEGGPDPDWEGWWWSFDRSQPSTYAVYNNPGLLPVLAVRLEFTESKFHDMLRSLTYSYLQRWPEKTAQMQAIFESHDLHLEPAPELLG